MNNDESTTREAEKTDRFSPLAGERVFGVGALLIASVCIAGYFFGEYLTARELLSVLVALTLSHLNFRSWRMFASAAGVSVLEPTAAGRRKMIARAIELVILKGAAIALLVTLYRDGGVPALERALIALVVYLITGALLLTFTASRTADFVEEEANSAKLP
ncbi:MAG: hypothetical protein U0136_09080 [Bdellovibrionota bacterium]